MKVLRIALFTAVFFTSTPAGAQTVNDFTVLEPLAGFDWSQVYAENNDSMSEDGSLVVGYSDTAGVDLVVWLDGVSTPTSIDQLYGSWAGGNFNDVSDNGYAATGYQYVPAAPGQYQAFRWTRDGGTEGLGFLPGGNYSTGRGISGDGEVVVGWANNGVSQRAFRWTETGGMVDLGDGEAQYVNYDGSVVAGYDATGVFHWTQGTGMVNIGDLGFGGFTGGYALSTDGSTIVGDARNAGGFYNAIAWTQAGGMVNLGTLGGDRSTAYHVSDDGSAIAGEAQIAGNIWRYFHWRDGVMVDVGTLGGADTWAYDLSGNGNVLVGESRNAGAVWEAFMWTEADGMRSIADVLTDAGVDISDWLRFEEAINVSADGRIISGYGRNLANDEMSFIMTVDAVTAALTTPEELFRAALPLTAVSQQSMAQLAQGMGQSLIVARNALSFYLPKNVKPVMPARRNSFDALVSMDPKVLAEMNPAAGGEDVIEAPLKPRMQKALYATGNIGVGQGGNFSSHAVSGGTGVIVRVSEYAAVGVGITGSSNKNELYLNGQSRVNAAGGTVHAAVETDGGLRLYTALAAAYLDASVDRNYLNGAAVDGSSGDTDGTGYAVVLRAGYETGVYDGVTIMPYIEGEWGHTTLDAYTETGGGFPAAIAEQEDDTVIGRIGAEISHQITPELQLRGRGAWGHRFSDGDGSVFATIAGFSLDVPGDAGDRDWAEGGMTANWRFSDRAAMSADLSGRAGRTAEPAVNLTVGLTWDLQ